jgi:hypothetical protein
MSPQTYIAVTHWMMFIFIMDIAVCLLVLIAFGIFKSTRGYAGGAVVVISWIAGATVWIQSAMLTYWLWGGAWVIGGIVLAGVGVLPFALIASAMAGDWGDFWALVVMMALTLGVRLIGIGMAASAEA